MTQLPARVLVCGFGRTGQAVTRVLAARGVAVRVVDQRDADTLGIDADRWASAELALGTTLDDPLAAVDLVVPSPGVPPEAAVLAAARRRDVPIASEIEVAFGLLDCPVLAITGTNGKSTTTTLVGVALETSGQRTFVGGNLGTPLIAAVDGRFDVAVAEVSSFQLEWVRRFRPAVGAVLNVSPDHLDRHGSFEAYRAMKGRLFAAQRETDVAVANHDDPEALALGLDAPGRLLTFGRAARGQGVFGHGDEIVCRMDEHEERYGLTRTRLIGAHNRENVMAAVVIARCAGASPSAVQHAIDTVAPLPHRLALVTERAGVRWYDDSKATNVAAVVKSLESFGGPVVLLAGGVDKGGDYGPLGAAIRGKARVTLVFGQAGPRIGAALEQAGIPVRAVASLDAAVEAAASAARAGDAVLLAPACSSFDMFTDYAARGRAFRAAVEGLG